MAEARRVSQATRFDNHTSLMTRAMASWRSSGSPSFIARAKTRSITLPTRSTSAAAEASANMNARVIASVSSGSRCIIRVIWVSSRCMRSRGVEPASGLRLLSNCSNSLASADTSRCTLDGKYR
ncbi:Uncharacterised protein [Mycobacteroides abscessus subsp. abscessus]|nr:Uncharacterised protein [Mycobacteroides abscessus subsp. abscessus]